MNRKSSNPQIITGNYYYGKDIRHSYVETPKFTRWVQAFYDKGSETYGNATRSAIKAYNLDEKRQYHVANNIGSKNVRKCEDLRLAYCDKEGFGFGDLIKIGIKKMMDGSFTDWVRFMTLLGYFETEDKQPTFQQFNYSEFFERARKERGLPV